MNKLGFSQYLFLVVIWLLVAIPVRAGCIDEEVGDVNSADQDVKKASAEGEKVSTNGRLKTFEPNYFVYRWSEDDEAALRAHFSLRYLTCRYQDDDAPVKILANSEMFFSYTGEFDFYVNTRPSGPVINRISNPAIHLRKRKLPLGVIDWVDFSFEHKSDGQSTEVTSLRDIERVELALLEHDHRYFDTISRGSNYFAVEVHVKGDWISAYSKLKLYESMDSAITWGDLRGKGIAISDYDRLTTVLRANLGGGELSVDWTLGDKLLKTDSWNADYLISKAWAIPLYFRVHHGPLYTLSNYTKTEDYFGIGVKLVP